MKVIIVALAFVTVAVAAAIEGEPQILRFDNNQDPEGSFRSEFELSDGTRREDQGERKTVQNEENKPQDVIVMRGSWSYVDPDGNVQNVVYFADETGFHADGPSVPKSVSRR